MIFSIKGVGLIGYSNGKKVNFDPYTNANFIQIIDRKFQSKIITFLKRNIGEYLHDCGAGKYFLSKTQKAR